MNCHLNCDMGEGFGPYNMADDAKIMPHISQANIACGFHASDPNHMRNVVGLAKKHSVQVGAHPSLPDRFGFGRREMAIERNEMFNLILYQVGALCAFLKQANMLLSHIKPHGALYGMAAKNAEIAEAIADVADIYDVPVFGLPGTLHEEVYTKRNIRFVSEFFADLDYSDEGKLLITREHKSVKPEDAAKRAMQVAGEGMLTTVGGKTLPIKAETICVHSDTPNAVDIVIAVKNALNNVKSEKSL